MKKQDKAKKQLLKMIREHPFLDMVGLKDSNYDVVADLTSNTADKLSRQIDKNTEEILETLLEVAMFNQEHKTAREISRFLTNKKTTMTKEELQDRVEELEEEIKEKDKQITSLEQEKEEALKEMETLETDLEHIRDLCEEAISDLGQAEKYLE